MQDFIHITSTLTTLFAEITIEDTIQPFIAGIIFIGMIVALMLPILAIPYIFIKMGSAAAKLQSMGNNMVKRGVKKGAGETKYGQALKQAKGIRASNRAQMGQDLLRRHGGKAGGVLLGGASREGRSMGQRRLEAMHREHDAKEIAFAKQDLIRRGVIGDTALRDRALDGNASEYERRASMELLAERGRVNPLRQVGQGLTSHEETEWFEQAVTANAGKVYGKAPDLNSGNPVPFTGNSAEDVAQFHRSTVQTALVHPSATDGHRQEMLEAYDQAMANPLLAAKIDQDTQSAWEDLRTQHNSRPGATPVNRPPSAPPSSPPPSSPPPSGPGGSSTPPPPANPPTGSGGTQPPLPPGASGGRSGSTGPSGLWTPGP